MKQPKNNAKIQGQNIASQPNQREEFGMETDLTDVSAVQQQNAQAELGKQQASGQFAKQQRNKK